MSQTNDRDDLQQASESSTEQGTSQSKTATPQEVKQQIVADFMTCLQKMEETGDVKVLAALFEEPAELTNVTRQNTKSKTPSSNKSAASFWSQYLHAFDYIRSHFTTVVEGQGQAVLEWVSVGRLTMGVPIEYSGVSIIEFMDGKIKKFRTYYDSAAFLPHMPHTISSYSNSVGVPEITNEATS